MFEISPPRVMENEIIFIHIWGSHFVPEIEKVYLGFFVVKLILLTLEFWIFFRYILYK